MTKQDANRRANSLLNYIAMELRRENHVQALKVLERALMEAANGNREDHSDTGR